MAGDLTAAQWASAMKADTYGLGFAAFVAVGDYLNCQGAANAIRDGATPYPGNGVVGPSGVITGATEASPIVITTGAPHGLANGDTVIVSNVGGNTAANNAPAAATPTVAAWPIIVLSPTTFSLTGASGNAAYTNGGTWQWCVYGQPNLNVTTADVTAAIAYQDIPGNGLTTTLTADQAVRLAMYQALCNQPGGTIELVNSAGIETVTATNLKKVAGGSGTGSFTRLSNLELRFGSLAEKLTGLIGNPIGQVATAADMQAAIATGNA